LLSLAYDHTRYNMVGTVIKPVDVSSIAHEALNGHIAHEALIGSRA
jgi:hypothetical protein